MELISSIAKVLILRTAGTNCDQETAFAFKSCGAEVDLLHVNRVKEGSTKITDYGIFVLPGGFTYGDDIASGKIFANELKFILADQIKKFIEKGGLVLGICNGFQVLVKAGLLPGVDTKYKDISATLTLNDSGRFEDRWCYLKKAATKCIWTQGIDDIIYLPIAHAEGKFIPEGDALLRKLEENGQIVFRYTTKDGKIDSSYPINPNGSVANVAGLCDPTGRILGMMPHPERHFLGFQHPRWTREGLKEFGDGAKIFRNGIDYVKKNLP